VAVGVVAQRDRIHAETEDLLGGLLGDAHAAGGVLAIDHHEVGRVALAKHRQQRGERTPTKAADYVGHEQELHWMAVCQPPGGATVQPQWPTP